MRTWRAVTYLSLAVLSLGLLVILTTPLRYPGYIILPFGPVLTFLAPAFATCALLVARLFVSHRAFSIGLLVTAGIFGLLGLTGHMAAVVLLASLVALALMYGASRTMRPPNRDPAPLQHAP